MKTEVTSKPTLEAMKKIEFTVSEPTVQESKNLTIDDVWGKVSEETFQRISVGMYVARGNSSYCEPDLLKRLTSEIPEICPVWGDKIGYKSGTFVGPADREDEIVYWLEYVHGGNSVSRRKELPGGKIALRSDYQCW